MQEIQHRIDELNKLRVSEFQRLAATFYKQSGRASVGRVMRSMEGVRQAFEVTELGKAMYTRRPEGKTPLSKADLLNIEHAAIGLRELQLIGEKVNWCSDCG